MFLESSNTLNPFVLLQCSASMPFSSEDKIVIKHYRVDKHYSVTKLLNKFPDRGWTLGKLHWLLKNIDDTCLTEHRTGSGHPKTSKTEENTQIVEKLILSQEDQPQTHKSLREIEMDTGISKPTVNRIVKRALHLKPVRLVKAAALTEDHKRCRLACCKQFLQRFTISKIGENIFY